MNKIPDLIWNPLNEWDMNKVLKLLKRNVVEQRFNGAENEKDEIIQKIAIFGFIKQILVERPALIHSVLNAVIQSHPVVSKYLFHTKLVLDGPEQPKPGYTEKEKELDILISYMVEQARVFYDETTVPEGVSIN